jgi:hypothetical protein
MAGNLVNAVEHERGCAHGDAPAIGGGYSPLLGWTELRGPPSGLAWAQRDGVLDGHQTFVLSPKLVGARRHLDGHRSDVDPFTIEVNDGPGRREHLERGLGLH